MERNHAVPPFVRYLAMDEASVIHYISESYACVDCVEGSGDRFFMYGLDSLPPERQMPFATLVTGDHYDTVSHLNRPGVFRLNIGVSRQTYLALFGSPAPRSGADGIVDTGHDYATLDRIMPHPVYAPQFWLCVLSPSETTFETLKPMLAEAYERSVSRHATMQKSRTS